MSVDTAVPAPAVVFVRASRCPPAWMLRGASRLGRSISPKTAVLVMRVSGCALLTPGSSESVALRWIRAQGHLKNWRGSVLQLGFIGCLCKRGFYSAVVLWFREVVNPCERAQHKGDGISRGFLLLHRVKQDSVLFMLHPLGIVCMVLQTEPCNKTDGSIRWCQEELCCFSPLPV